MDFHIHKGREMMSMKVARVCNAPDGKEIRVFTLVNASGMRAELCNIGASVLSLYTPDRWGKYEDIVLGYERLESYLDNSKFLGAVIGRHANRIEDAAFELGGIKYELARNEGNNHLHGGYRGFGRAIWDTEIANADSVTLSYFSKDTEEGYPGSLQVKVIYTLTADNGLRIDYYATSDKDTVVNLTNHSYFNLVGHAAGDISKHQLMIAADAFTPIDENSIPTGEIRAVGDTELDFRNMKEIGNGLGSGEEQIIKGKGYDHNFVLNSSGDITKKAAEVYEPICGRKMEVYTTKPGIQFYSGNHLEGSDVGKGGVIYKKRSGFCLETQYFPNALKHQHFPSCVLKKGEEYRHTTIYKFQVK